MTTNQRKPNRLINEKSPYLLQHAYNPVNWYSWSEEAFDKAKAEDKPIFLSIGYSTCHWCHVMERESFEDEEVAQLLNDFFIAIKVDKEERPDVDGVYMAVCQTLTGHGGWPLTIVMTPEQKPFFAGTYLPKHSNGHMMGLMELLTAINLMWTKDRKRILQSSEEITGILKREVEKHEEGMQPTKDMIHSAFRLLRNNFDEEFGGFGKAPKFPTPHNLMFLLRYAVFEKDKIAYQMVEETLTHMYQGGIYDHIGGGFSRYSTDNYWLVPHFEKMLYDNALLAITYLEAYQVSKNKLFTEVAERTLDYVMREMTDKDGGFYSAQDADSEGVEGKYYVFTAYELLHVLGEEQGTKFNQYYDISSHGNFEGCSIPNRIQQNQADIDEESLEEMRKQVYHYRLHRTKLHKDDKILTSWNSLMIVAFCKGYYILQKEEYRVAAKVAADFILKEMTEKSGRLKIRYRDGEAVGVGTIDDYSFFTWALLELYSATFQVDYLKKAIHYAKEMIDLFWHGKHGGFYFYAKDAETLITRPKETYDGAMPSGNSVATYVLAKLDQMTGDSVFREIKNCQLEFMGGVVSNYPAGYSFGCMAFMLDLYPSRELICVTDQPSHIHGLQLILKDKFTPNTVVLVKDEENKKILSKMVEYLRDYTMKDERTTFYLCENHACMEPFHDLAKVEEALNCSGLPES